MTIEIRSCAVVARAYDCTQWQTTCSAHSTCWPKPRATDSRSLRSPTLRGSSRQRPLVPSTGCVCAVPSARRNRSARRRGVTTCGPVACGRSTTVASATVSAWGTDVCPPINLYRLNKSAREQRERDEGGRGVETFSPVTGHPQGGPPANIRCLIFDLKGKTMARGGFRPGAAGRERQRTRRRPPAYPRAWTNQPID